MTTKNTTCRTYVLLALGLVASVLLAACNTIDGLGKDVQRAGEKVQSMTRK